MFDANANLSDQDLATLINHLEIPATMQELLADTSRDDISDDMHFALHDAIADMQPDCALLAITLSARHIIIAQGAVSPALCVLDMECKRLTQEYGGLWLRNAHGSNNALEDEAVMDILSLIPEDLEGLADLLQNASPLLNGKAAILAEILQIQARAHALIAETFVEAMEQEDTMDTDGMAAHILPTEFRNNNVIQFPGNRV